MGSVLFFVNKCIVSTLNVLLQARHIPQPRLHLVSAFFFFFFFFFSGVFLVFSKVFLRFSSVCCGLVLGLSRLFVFM